MTDEMDWVSKKNARKEKRKLLHAIVCYGMLFYAIVCLLRFELQMLIRAAHNSKLCIAYV